MTLIERFTRARKVTVGANYGTHTLEYVIPADRELHINELFLSSTKIITAEVRYSTDGGTTWVNPWDTESEYLLWLVLGAGILAAGRPNNTWFAGDGVNTKLQIKLTNTESTDATVFYLVKGIEKINEA